MISIYPNDWEGEDDEKIQRQKLLNGLQVRKCGVREGDACILMHSWGLGLVMEMSC
jgi:hypothetical protein